MTAAPIDPPSPPTARHRRARALLTGLFCTYIVAIIAVALVLRFVGEAWWVSAAALYLPRIGFAAPLPLFVLALAVWGPRRALWLLPVPAAVLLLPLMGLQLGGVSLLRTAQAARAGLRVLSYNIGSARDAPAIAATIAAANADLVVLQEWEPRNAAPIHAVLAGYHHDVTEQFAVFSRHPISDVRQPPRITIPGSPYHSARFVRYRIDVPGGPITLFNVHPVSPRAGLLELRAAGLSTQVRTGALGRGAGIAVLRANTLLRQRQVEAIAAAAAVSPHPVIVAGDTNLPGLSRVLAESLGGLADGFAVAGVGFGYTFPTDRPWMRIDRILASRAFSFTRFDVLPGVGSDHLAIAADLSPR